jgi:hypothetical protein
MCQRFIRNPLFASEPKEKQEEQETRCRNKRTNKQTNKQTKRDKDLVKKGKGTQPIIILSKWYFLLIYVLRSRLYMSGVNI